MSIAFFAVFHVQNQTSLFLTYATIAAACLCDLNGRSCSPDVLTNFNNEASLCIFSKRDLVKIDLLRIQWGVTRHDIIDNSEIVDGDLSSSAIKLEGTHGSAVFKIPKSFFTGMEDSGGSLRDVGLIQGHAVGVAAIKSDSGGNSEVGMTCMFGEKPIMRKKLIFFFSVLFLLLKRLGSELICIFGIKPNRTPPQCLLDPPFYTHRLLLIRSHHYSHKVQVLVQHH